MSQGEKLRLAIKGKGITAEEAAKKMGMSRTTLYVLFGKTEFDNDTLQNVKSRLDIDLFQAETGDDLRRKRAFGDMPRGLRAVPVAAQAGYIQHFLDPVFIEDLQTFDMPGMPYYGPNYRLFQVSGDSMEVYNKVNRPEGLSDGMWVIAKKIEPEYWHQTFDFFVHVIVTDTRIMIKRLKREKYEAHPDRYYFVCISDNEDVYPQFTLDPSEIRELWEVERKIDWNMAPPKRFEITIKRDAPPETI
ncbi:MAG: LexA family transcriptional regulator [Sphingobacteriales bacterium]|nr:MAG: LexA family transcriptional regulator [Sphingobacteriales bacterium]